MLGLPEMQGKEDFLAATDYREAPSLDHIIRPFKEAIQGNRHLLMLLDRSIEESKLTKYPVAFKNLDELCSLLNTITQNALPYSEGSYTAGPFVTLFEPLANTNSGRSLFNETEFNRQIRDLLDGWALYLNSDESAAYLNTEAPTGWFCEAAAKKIDLEAWEHDKSKPHYGFHSWNMFFERRIAPGARPIAAPDDNTVVAAPCESMLQRYESDVASKATFWIKEQPYSIEDMLDCSPANAERYVGGSCVQGWLSSTNYHRWHSPVNGVVKSIRLIENTYLTVSPEIDSPSMTKSMAYLSHLATRSLIEIESEAGHRVMMVFVGVAEVSSCKPTVREGQSVKKGSEIGTFSYGGSSYVMLWEKGANFKLTKEASSMLGDKKKTQLVRGQLGTID